MSTASREMPAPWFRASVFFVLRFLLVALFLLWLAQYAQVAPPAVHAPVVGPLLFIVGLVGCFVGLFGVFFLNQQRDSSFENIFSSLLLHIYPIFPYPFFAGMVLGCCGASLHAGSAAGLWLVTPLCAFGCVALVWGYERPAGGFQWVLGCREKGGLSEGCVMRLRALMGMLVPYVFFLCAFDRATLFFEAGAFIQPGGVSEPSPFWSVIFFSCSATLILFAFFCSSSSAFSSFYRRCWLALLVLGIWLLPVSMTTWTNGGVAEVGWNKEPAFVLYAVLQRNIFSYACCITWSVLAAVALATRSLLWAASAWWGVGVVVLSLLGMKVFSFGFVVLPLLLGGVLCQDRRIWLCCLRWAERLANSMRAKRYGAWRVLNHAPYSFISGFLCLFIPVLLLGKEWLWPLTGMFVLGVVAAALWGQLLEGTASLQRPFGYFGTVAGLVVCGSCLLFIGVPVWELMAAIACSAPWIQASGRLRCLVQGCCHGGPLVPVQEEQREETKQGIIQGIVVTNPLSRVVTLSKLGGVLLYPTQVYSMVGNCFIGLLLLQGWRLGVASAVLCGLYLLLSGVLRFVEEGYRGEAQTLFYGGLSVYQWLALFLFFTGCFLLIVPSPAAPSSVLDWWGALWPGLCAGVLVTFAMSVDRPDSTCRFARLSG